MTTVIAKVTSLEDVCQPKLKTLGASHGLPSRLLISNKVVTRDIQIAQQDQAGCPSADTPFASCQNHARSQVFCSQTYQAGSQSIDVVLPNGNRLLPRQVAYLLQGQHDVLWPDSQHQALLEIVPKSQILLCSSICLKRRCTCSST